jgi:predicted nucleotidyltransferase
MRSQLRYPLDRVFSSGIHIAILRALQDSREGMSGRAIARLAGVNHQACAMALKNLDVLGVLQRQGAGKVQLISLNFDNHLIGELILPLLRKERDLLKSVRQDVVDTFKKEALAITLFGSVARKQDVPGSDMDILLVVKGTDKDQVMDQVTRTSSGFVKKYGVRLSPIVLTVREVQQRIKQSDPLMKNILSEGIDLLPRKLSEVIS